VEAADERNEERRTGRTGSMVRRGKKRRTRC